MNDQDDHYLGAQIEEIRDTLRGVAEVTAMLPGVVQDIKDLKDDVAELASDMKAVKAAVTDQSRVLRDHEQRITRIEQAV